MLYAHILLFDVQCILYIEKKIKLTVFRGSKGSIRRFKCRLEELEIRRAFVSLLFHVFRSFVPERKVHRGIFNYILTSTLNSFGFTINEPSFN